MRTLQESYEEEFELKCPDRRDCHNCKSYTSPQCRWDEQSNMCRPDRSSTEFKYWFERLDECEDTKILCSVVELNETHFEMTIDNHNTKRKD